MDQVTEVSLYRPKPSDFIAFLPFACRQLEAPFQLRILVETIEEYVSKSAVDDKAKRSKRDKTPHTQTSVGQYSVEKETSVVEQQYDENEVVLRARCDALGRPVELLFYRCVQIPRLLIKIIGLCIPYHEQLTRFAVRWGPLDGATLYEIAKFLPQSQVTDIRLDDSPVLHRNYHLLLERPSHLHTLSLARCGLVDAECVALAACLAHPRPASLTLASLSLESNRIGDQGARALGDALRTNRTLRHLNLAGNAITSLGAADLFRSLTLFPVSSEEIISKKRRTFDYLKLKMEAYERCYHKLTQSSEQQAAERVRAAGSHSHRASVAPSPLFTKDSGVETLASRAEALVLELVGARADPFDLAQLVMHSDMTYCLGNFSLRYLNLAYNDLDCTSARRLADVLVYQAGARRCPDSGLLRVVLEGNAVPAVCDAARASEGMLERSLDVALTTTKSTTMQIKPGRKSERPKFK